VSCRHDPLTGGQQLSVEQQFLGRSFLAVGVDSDLDLHLAVQVGAGGQDDALRGGQDRSSPVSHSGRSTSSVASRISTCGRAGTPESGGSQPSPSQPSTQGAATAGAQLTGILHVLRRTTWNRHRRRGAASPPTEIIPRHRHRRGLAGAPARCVGPFISIKATISASIRTTDTCPPSSVGRAHPW
jgi:hypothetical protein